MSYDWEESFGKRRTDLSSWNRPATSIDEKLDCLERQADEDGRPFDRKAERIAMETGVRRHALIPDAIGVGHKTQAEADEASKKYVYTPAEPRAWTPIRKEPYVPRPSSMSLYFAESRAEEEKAAAQRAKDAQLVKEAAEREQKLRASLRGRFLLFIKRLMRV